MKQIAKVVLQGGKPMAEVVRPEPCEACHACRYGRQERMLMDLPDGDYQEGDEIELTLPDGRIGAASMLAYGFPLIFLLTGLFVGQMLFHTDLGAALSALAMLGVSLIVIKLLEPRLRKSGLFRPESCPHTQPLDPPNNKHT